MIHTIKKQFKKEHIENNNPHASWFSVGLKMMIGVGIISLSCMGVLLYINYQAFARIGQETNTILNINEEMNAELRASIFDLQKKYLDIPKLLKVDPAGDIREWIQNNYKIEKELTLKGRDRYRGKFNRSQRRDISKGNFVVQTQANTIVISKGRIDKNGDFEETIDQMFINSGDPGSDQQIISEKVSAIILNSASAEALEQKVLQLKATLADEAIAAEKARNAILYKVEDMTKKKNELIRSRRNKLKTIGTLAAIAILVNLLLLHFMAWFVIEKPLKKLTRVIETINKGETIPIPYQTRKDRIGLLASVEAVEKA